MVIRHSRSKIQLILLLLLRPIITSTFIVFTTFLASFAIILINIDQVITFASYLSPCRDTSLSFSLSILLISYPITTLSPHNY